MPGDQLGVTRLCDRMHTSTRLLLPHLQSKTNFKRAHGVIFSLMQHARCPLLKDGSLYKCSGACVPVSCCRRRGRLVACASSNGAAGHRQKMHDVIGLSNLCVDIVIPVDKLPLPDPVIRQELLQQLTAHPPSQEQWELGGNCNFMIAAARLGMRVGSIGHVGNDVYGQYMDRVLQEERIEAITRIMPPQLCGTDLDKTLLCFVLVDQHGQHTFCSRYDFGPWPLLGGVSTLPPSVTQVLRSTAAVFTNGFVFDELPLNLVKDAMLTASEAGAAILFDPGPRAFTMKSGSRRQALDALIDLSDVVLMTEEEAHVVTGHSDPQAAAETILSRPNAKTQWCVVKLGGEGALLVTKSPEQQVFRAGAFKVDVKDTVGCGDSFAAAIVLGFIRTHDVHATLLLANAVGAATAMGRGAGTNVANAKTVLGLLEQAASNSNGGSSSSGLLRRDVDQALTILQESLSSADLLGLANSSSNGGSSGSGQYSSSKKTPAAHAA